MTPLLTMADAPTKGDLDAALARARNHAPFLRRLLNADPDLETHLANNRPEPSFAAISKQFDTSRTDTMEALRKNRQKLALYVAIGDLGGSFSFEQTVSMLSDFADFALQLAIDQAFSEIVPEAAVEGLSAISVGKHGSQELNYSSDIDILLLFDPQTLPVRGKDDPQQTAIRISKRIVDILQSMTGAGYVLRVDLRLRPAPEATPLALSLDAAISHYETSAEPWERAAFIRARASAGDIALGERFLEAIQPFVWRRALDFGAIQSIRDISHRIRSHYAQGQAFGPGYDIKRGRGGIREIEFFVQIHQLIHGGRDRNLRQPATVDALAALGKSGWIEPEIADRLAACYRLFRTVEHRLQMVEDRQTHSLPTDADALDNVAQLYGVADGDALLKILSEPINYVAELYDELEGDKPDRLPHDPAALEARLIETGFETPESARRLIEGWRGGRHRTTQSKAARDGLEAILPGLVADIGQSPDPAAAINRFDGLLARLPSAVNFFRLIEARPGLGRLLVLVLSHAPALADELARRGELFDSLIDATALEPPESLDELREIMESRSQSSDYQLRLDRMRQIVGEERFALGVQLLEGASDPLDIASGYSRVAEAALEVLTSATIAEFEEDFGTIQDSELLIVALGRLGGEALTHASDLDLVFLFTGDHGSVSSGRRSLGATKYYQRLAQQVTAALSVPTAAGPLYDVDTRLRPSGAQGLLAVSIESFEAYHREYAWTWEHMALARARLVYGTAPARTLVAGIIDGIIARDRDKPAAIADIVAMRAEIASHKPPSGELDVKLIEGGLVDLEFCVHLIQLCERTGCDPHLPKAIAEQVAAGVLAPEMAGAHDLLTRMLVTLRLVSPTSLEVAPRSQRLVASRCGATDWNSLLAHYEQARHCVRSEWRRLTGASG
jgi:glutamate-ammonia-ligase adenylyltransferase